MLQRLGRRLGGQGRAPWAAARLSTSSNGVREKVLKLDPLHPKLCEHRRTKLICTVGPATWDEEGITGLLAAGMNVLRINCSHGDHALYERVIRTVRDAVSAKDQRSSQLLDSVNVSCAVALDTKGPEIRLGDFAVATPVLVEAGKQMRLLTNPAAREAMTETDLFVDYASLRGCVSPGSKVFIDDGLLSLEVESFETDAEGHDVIVCKAENTASIGSRKGVNLPGAKLDLPAVSEKDRNDLEFAREQGVDFIFASFIRRREHIREIRDIVGPDVGIIAKIENAEGIQNIDGIIEESDGVMVARGDLGIEIPQENVFLAQKMIVAKANLQGKPAICATQMLDSMTRSPRPTRAECADVANAVLDGCDAVMLSGETANGLYPAQTVGTMSRICLTAEYSIDHRHTIDAARSMAGAHLETRPICEALILSAVVAAYEERAKLLIVLSETGISAKIAAKYRPSACILCITSNQKVARQLQLSHGIRVHAIPKGMDIQEAITSGIRKGHDWGLLGKGERVVAVHSQGEVMRLLEVPQWIGRV